MTEPLKPHIPGSLDALREQHAAGCAIQAVHRLNLPGASMQELERITAVIEGCVFVALAKYAPLYMVERLEQKAKTRKAAGHLSWRTLQMEADRIRAEPEEK